MSDQANTGVSRRRFLIGTGAAGTIALAGCTSGDGGDGGSDGGSDGSSDGGSDGGDGGTEAWPPTRNTVEIVSPASPGDTRDTLPRLWANNAEYPDGITTRITPTPGAGGLIASNQVWNAEPVSGSLLTQGMVPMGILQLTNDAVQYEMSEFEQIMAFQTKARAIQVSHHSTDVEDHWDWDWETFTTKVKEENLKFGATAITQFLLRNFIEVNDPNLSEGDIEIVPFDSGGNARATIERGELDGYFGGFGPNYPRDSFYKTQFVFADPRYEAYHEQAQKIDENAVFITDTSFPTDAAEATIDATIDGLAHRRARPRRSLRFTRTRWKPLRRKTRSGTRSPTASVRSSSTSARTSSGRRPGTSHSGKSRRSKRTRISSPRTSGNPASSFAFFARCRSGDTAGKTAGRLAKLILSRSRIVHPCRCKSLM
jgi:hypothetical protein